MSARQSASLSVLELEHAHRGCAERRPQRRRARGRCGSRARAARRARGRGARTRRAARPSRRRSSAGRRARSAAARAPRARRAAAAPRGAAGGARRRAPGRPPSDGTTAPRSASSSSSCQWIDSDVLVERLDPHAVGLVALELGAGAGQHDVQPRPCARARNSASSRDLPIPGSPSMATHAGPLPSSAASSQASSGVRPTSGSGGRFRVSPRCSGAPRREPARMPSNTTYERRWKTLGVLSLSLLLIGLGQHRLERRAAHAADALLGVGLDAAVDRRRVPAGLRRRAADDGDAR